jgi:hypothetical protein
MADAGGAPTFEALENHSCELLVQLQTDIVTSRNAHAGHDVWRGDIVFMSNYMKGKYQEGDTN